jgi:hypothetical protein
MSKDLVFLLILTIGMIKFCGLLVTILVFVFVIWFSLFLED